MSQGDFLDRPDAQALSEEAHEILARAKEHFRPVATFGLFSGGDDSTRMLRLMKDDIDSAVHIRTGIGIQSTFEHVQKTCDALRVPLIVLQTDPNEYRKIVLSPKAKGFPGPALHYVCYHRLKQHRIRALQRDHSKRGEKILLVSGVRRKESKRRAASVAKKEWRDQSDHECRRCVWVNPLVSFDSRDMLTIGEALDVPRCEAAERIHKSGECLCGAFAAPGELEELAFWFPDVAAYIRDLEKEAEAAGKPYCKWGHGKIQGGPAKEVGPLCQGCTLFDKPESVS